MKYWFHKDIEKKHVLGRTFIFRTIKMDFDDYESNTERKDDVDLFF